MTSGRLRTLLCPRAAATGVAYFAASGFAISLTRFGGGAAFLWVATAVLLGTLTTLGRRQWFPVIAWCWAGNVLAAAIWGLGWRIAPLIAGINVAEALIGALLIRRWGVDRSALDSVAKLGLFIVAAGVVAPGVTGAAAAGLISTATGTPILFNLEHWFVAHGLGALAFSPIVALVASGDLRRWFARTSAKRIWELALLLALVAATAAGVFAQSRLPLLFLPMLPLILTAFRTGRTGSALAIVIVAGVSTVLTLKDMGPITLIDAGLGGRLQFLQLYLTATVLTVFPVAADLTRRAQLFEQLRDSEARFRLLTEQSTDIILSLDVDGTIRYASPSITRLGGYDPARLVGTASLALVEAEDRARVVAAHLAALARPDETVCVEYRGIVLGAQQRWFETRTRAVTDDQGNVCGTVSVVRDTSARHQAEVELHRAAHTDPLTGLCNRRAFDGELARLLARPGEGAAGCVAIFDLDHFKRINDAFGHGVGDEVLRAFARAAAAQVRSGDMLARIGGEEFGLIFAAIPLGAAQAVCERIREAVAETSVRAGVTGVRATVSVGLAPLHEGDDVAAVMRRADEALYVSKTEGRNRLSLAA